MNGAAVGVWEYHFPTFNAATEATRGFRLIGLAFDAVRIKAVDGFLRSRLTDLGQ
jgi:hypothetical protein